MHYLLPVVSPSSGLSTDRQKLLLGDDEIVFIWNVANKRRESTIEDPHRKWGQITSLFWLPVGGSEGHQERRLAIGTGRGLMIIYGRSHANVSPPSLPINDQPKSTQETMVELSAVRAFEPNDSVEAIAYDAKMSRLAITSHLGNIALYEVGKNGKKLWVSQFHRSSPMSGTTCEIWTASVGSDRPAIARSVSFYDAGRKLLIFVLETGEM